MSLQVIMGNNTSYTSTSALLALEDGTVFHGKAIGAINNLEYTTGELVFNTSMTGYQEIISDPSYCNQIIMFTQPHIGNVGVNTDDDEFNQANKIWSKGIVVKSLSNLPSNWRSQQTLEEYLIKHNLIGIANIDTRELTNILRTKGAQRSCIYILGSKDLEQSKKEAIKLAAETTSLVGLDLAKHVSCNKMYNWDTKTLDLKAEYKQVTNKITSQKTGLENNHNLYHIVVYDFGVKQQILKLLADRNCRVTVVPAQTPVPEVMNLKPDGILLSNGPGDPAACSYAIDAAKKLISLEIPIFGICLGFQILALALGAKTTKMKFGHHGGNHPVKDLETGRVVITSQNHGFMVDEASITPDIEVSHKSLFDHTVQGLRHNDLPVIGFQGHPEASPGPNDIEYLFDLFIKKIENYKLQTNKPNQPVNVQQNSKAAVG